MTERDRWVALYVLCAGVLMIVLDTTVVNVALPSIQDDLGFSSAGLAWVVNAYLIAFAGLLLLAGRLGDLVGRRRVLLGGLALFTGASLLCGAAQTQEMLVVARFLQGVGGALASAVTLGMIVTMFPEPAKQAKAMGVFAFVASAGGALGLVAGGLITESISWHWIFLVNIPIGLLTVALVSRYVPQDKGIGLREGADVCGAVLVTGALMLAVYTVVGPAAESGWGSSQVLSLGVLAVVLLVAFLVRQAKAVKPLMPLRLLRSRTTVGANIVQMLTVAGMFGMFFMGSLYLQRVLGYDALQIGFAFVPLCLVMGVLSLHYSDKVALRFGVRNTVVGGLLLVVVSLAWFAQAPLHGRYALHVLPVMTLMGIGSGVAFPALMTVVMADSSPEDAGLASGLANTTAQAGAALGLAVLATLSTSRAGHLLVTGQAEKVSLLGGYQLALWVAAAVVAVGVVVAVTVLKPGPAEDDGLVSRRYDGGLAFGDLRAGAERDEHGTQQADGSLVPDVLLVAEDRLERRCRQVAEPHDPHDEKHGKADADDGATTWS